MSSVAKLTIVHITDVYVLDNFPHLRTLLAKKKAENPNTVSMLTGDFLAPYLLSSIDKGVAMMDMIVKTPIDYLTWGNHEADIEHEEVCKRVKEFHSSGGVWINSNMQSHELMELQKPYEIIKVRSGDGSHERQVGLIAVLTDDKSLYKKFRSPGAFNGATIDCPWETLRKYKEVLEKMNCDLVLPLQHLYEHEDKRTCEDFDFPIILSGHDHHRVDKEINGTRLLKPGADGHYATVLDIAWEDAGSSAPSFSWEFVRLADYDADEAMVRAMEAAYSPLTRIRKTELAPVPDHFRPLSSVNSRGQVTTMGKFVCTIARDAINTDPNRNGCDLCMIRGGHICGEKDYPPDSFFSLEDLKTVNTDKVNVGVVEMPGEVIVRGVKTTRGGISRLFVQYDDGVAEEDGIVVRLAGEAVDPERRYRVATTPTTVRDIAAFADYFRAAGEALRDEEFTPLDVELLSYLGRSVFRRIIRLCDPEGTGRASFSAIDQDGDGVISKAEIQSAMKNLGLSVADGEFTLVEFIVQAGDVDKDGTLMVDELQRAVAAVSEKRRKSNGRKRDTYGNIEIELSQFKWDGVSTAPR